MHSYSHPTCCLNPSSNSILEPPLVKNPAPRSKLSPRGKLLRSKPSPFEVICPPPPPPPTHPSQSSPSLRRISRKGHLRSTLYQQRERRRSQIISCHEVPYKKQASIMRKCILVGSGCTHNTSNTEVNIAISYFIIS